MQVNVPWRHIIAVRKWVNVNTPPHPTPPHFCGPVKDPLAQTCRLKCHMTPDTWRLSWCHNEKTRPCSEVGEQVPEKLSSLTLSLLITILIGCYSLSCWELLFWKKKTLKTRKDPNHVIKSPLCMSSIEAFFVLVFFGLFSVFLSFSLLF